MVSTQITLTVISKANWQIKMSNRKQIYSEFAPPARPKGSLACRKQPPQKAGSLHAALQYGNGEGVEPFGELQYEDDTET